MKMAFTRIKQEKHAVDIEVARAKLNVALQTAMEKKNDSPSSSDEDSNRGGSTEASVKNEPLPSAAAVSLKKQPSKTQRKRRRKDDGSARNANSYVMKLFDRAVDLSPFTEDTPLYPICRAWINNQPHQSPVATSDDEQVKDEVQITDIPDEFDKASSDQEPKDIYQLPLPISYAKEYPKDLRIPSPIPAPEEEFVIRSDTVGAPSKEALMEKHMERWRAVRQKWKKAAQTNEDRYRKSAKVLKSIFERSQAQEDSENQELWDAVKSVT